MNNDKNYSTEVGGYLRSIGKRCFINCFERALENNGILTDDEIINYDPKVGRKKNGLNTRRSRIKKIFEERCAEQRQRTAYISALKEINIEEFITKLSYITDQVRER